MNMDGEQVNTRIRTDRFILAFILLSTLVFRLALFFDVSRTNPRSMILVDSLSYELPAQALFQLGRFADSPVEHALPEVRRTPGYPVFILMAQILIGEGHASIVVVQIAFGLLTLLLTYHCARFIWPGQSATALLAVVLAAWDPVSILFSQYIMSETVFAVFVMAGIYCCLRLIRPGARTLLWALAAGLTCAMAVHIRPIGYYYLFPVMGWAFFALRQRGRPWLHAAYCAMLIVIPWLLLVGGWHLRNYRQTGHADFCQIQSINLYLFRAADVMAMHEGRSIVDMQSILESRAEQAVRSNDVMELYPYYKREGVRLLLAHPWLTIRSMAHGFMRGAFGQGSIDLCLYIDPSLIGTRPLGDLLNLPLREYIHRWVLNRPLVTGLLAIETVLLGLCYFGLIAIPIADRHRFAERWPIHSLLIGTVLYYLFMSAGPEAFNRMRLPVTPILAMYGACLAQQIVMNTIGRFQREC